MRSRAILAAVFCLAGVVGGDVSEGDFYPSDLQSFSDDFIMTGGVILGDLNLYGSHPEIYGGYIGDFLAIKDTSEVSMYGGHVVAGISSPDYGRFNWYGGTIEGVIRSGWPSQPSQSHHTIYGYDFKLDGQEITNPILGGGSYLLTGYLQDGSPINNRLFIHASSSTIELVTVPEPTAPPVADAGSGQTVTDTDGNGIEEVTLDGSGSSDSDGTIVSWEWVDDLGDTIPDGEIVSAALSIGIHTVTLTVTDDDGLADSNTVTVSVEPRPSFPPDANANGPYTIFVGDTLTLDANGSTDDDNDIVSYMWDLDDDGVFETDAGDQPIYDVNYSYLESIGLILNHTYTVRLKVTDSEDQNDTDDSTLTIIPKPALQVAVDIKPGGCPNPVNTRSSGVLPVAILGTTDVNVLDIVPTSIRLAGVEPLRNSYEDVATPVGDVNDCNCTEAGPDGFLDLTLKFETQAIVKAIGDVDDGDVLTLSLTGVLYDPIPYETPIEGNDCILVKGKHRVKNKADINKDGVVNMIDFTLMTKNWLRSIED